MSRGRPRKYRATGCKYHDNCDTCPYPNCLLDSGLIVQKVKGKARVEELFTQGLSLTEVAKTLGKSVRTIQRYEKEIRGEKVE